MSEQRNASKQIRVIYYSAGKSYKSTVASASRVLLLPVVLTVNGGNGGVSRVTQYIALRGGQQRTTLLAIGQADWSVTHIKTSSAGRQVNNVSGLMPAG